MKRTRVTHHLFLVEIWGQRLKAPKEQGMTYHLRAIAGNGFFLLSAIGKPLSFLSAIVSFGGIRVESRPHSSLHWDLSVAFLIVPPASGR